MFGSEESSCDDLILFQSEPLIDLINDYTPSTSNLLRVADTYQHQQQQQVNRKIQSARGPIRGLGQISQSIMNQYNIEQPILNNVPLDKRINLKGINPVIQDAYQCGIIGPYQGKKRGGSALDSHRRRQNFQAPLLVNRVQSAQGGPRPKRNQS